MICEHEMICVSVFVAKADKPIVSQDSKGQTDTDQKDKHTGDISTGE